MEGWWGRGGGVPWHQGAGARAHDRRRPPGGGLGAAAGGVHRGPRAVPPPQRRRPHTDRGLPVRSLPPPPPRHLFGRGRAALRPRTPSIAEEKREMLCQRNPVATVLFPLLLPSFSRVSGSGRSQTYSRRLLSPCFLSLPVGPLGAFAPWHSSSSDPSPPATPVRAALLPRPDRSPDMRTAQGILRRLRKRDLYKFVDEVLLDDHSSHLARRALHFPSSPHKGEHRRSAGTAPTTTLDIGRGTPRLLWAHDIPVDAHSQSASTLFASCLGCHSCIHNLPLKFHISPPGFRAVCSPTDSDCSLRLSGHPKARRPIPYKSVTPEDVIAGYVPISQQVGPSRPPHPGRTPTGRWW